MPVTEDKPHKSRRGIYRLRAPFFRFWFRFVHPNRTLLERGGFTPQVEDEAARRDDLLLFDMSRIAG